MSIANRIVTDENGIVRLLKEAPTGPVTLSGQTIVKRASAKLKPSVSAVVTRSEAAKILGVEIEEAAKILDVHDVGKVLAYDRAHIEALAKALREHKPTVERTIAVNPELSLKPEPS